MRDREKRRGVYGERWEAWRKKGRGRGAVKRWWEARKKREKKREKVGGLWRWWEAEKREGGRQLRNVTLGLGFFLFILGFFFKCWHGWTGSVRFGWIGFRLWKPKPNRTGIFLWFFNRLIRFFFCSVFSVIFFRFFRFIGFFAHP